MLFGKAILCFINDLNALGSSENTIYVYGKFLNDFNRYLVRVYNRPLHLDEITISDVEKYLYNELPEGKYSDSSRHSMITAFKSLYNFCERKGYCTINMGKLIRNVKIKTEEREPIDEIEFMKLVKCISSDTVRVVVYTLFYTGLRITECLHLQLEDVDLEHDVIITNKGKGNRERRVPIHHRLKKVLLKYLEEERMEANTGFFFSGKSGKMSRQYVNKALKAAAAKAGIEKRIFCHLFRHSLLSNLKKRGAGILERQKIAGHKSINTLEIYTHTSEEELMEAVNLL